jgi:lipopolysaccharide assembly outer membrane protein LptD (OstA)
MRYNFDTKKAKIKSIITQQGEGYLHSTQTKRLQTGEIHIKDGKYTTCDSPLPHFYISLTKAISIPGKRTISGPAYLVFEDIPMPLGLPFGFFPNTNKRASGFLIPEFRDEQRRGFGLENGGWYFALNDYVDFSIVGSIYSRGTWGLRTISEYRVNYKYSGQFSAQFFMNRINDDPRASSSKDFKINWSHTQDAKANPTRTFRASVDFSTSSYEKRQGTSFSDVLENQKNSSISFTKRWPGRPFNFSANLNGTQSTRTNMVDLTLPSVAFNMERIYPFRGKNTSGDYNWLENITLSYNSRFLNRVNAPDSTLFTESTLKRMENGFTHTIPISLSNIKVLKNYVNITPSVSYSGTVFPYYVRKSVSADSSIFSGASMVTDTIHKITYAHAFSASLSISTSPKLYGTYLSKKENSKIIAVRHVITPRAGLSFSPDMKGLVPDYYRSVATSSSITQQTHYTEYSVYEGQMNPTPTVSGKSGSVSLALGNNLEAKVRSKSDTTGEGKKVSILDNLDFSTSYRPFAPTNKWAPVNVTSRSSLFNKKLSLQFSGTLDPYALDSLGRTSNKYLISESGKLFRLTRAQFSTSFSLQSGAGKKKEITGDALETESYDDVPEDVADMYDEAGGSIRSEYVNFDIPWSIYFDYSWSYSKSGLTKSINSSLNMRGDISLTPKWKIGASSAYDFVAKEFSATVIRIHRDLHCWEMSFSIVPFGNYKSYSFTINAKSAILRDLKWDKRKVWQDNF